MPRSPVPVALLVSLGLHGAVGMWVKVGSMEVAHSTEWRPDVWSGPGIEIDPATVDVTPTTEAATAEPASAANHESATNATESPEPSVALEPLCVTDCTPAAKQPPPVVAKRPAPKPAPTPTTSATASTATTPPSASATGSATSGATAAGGDAFGTVGLPPGVRYLPKAYTRALNQGNHGVRGFATAPAGKLCDARFSIVVGDDRRVGDVEYPSDTERDATPPLCRTMFENGLRLVRGGEFSLDPTTLNAGTLRLRVEVEIADGVPSSNCQDDPLKMCSESYDPPAPGKRGRATFTLNSGRRVDAFVNLE